MKNLWLFVPVAALLVCSCQKKAAFESVNTPIESTAPVAQSAPPTPSPKEPPKVETPLPEELTPAQLASTLRVRVAFGGMPPRDCVGALLHRDEIANKALAQGRQRFVLALLAEWDEAQLRSPSAVFVVYRNKVNAQGNTSARTFSARLVQFDAATHQALLTYTDDFEYSADAGFHLERPATLPHRFSILRTAGELQSSLPAPPRPAFPNMPNMPTFTRAPAFKVQLGAYEEDNGKEATPRFPSPAAGEKVDEALLAVRQPDQLLGFLPAKPEGAGAMVPVSATVVDIKTPVLKVKTVTFGQARGYGAEFELSVEATPADLVPTQASLRVLASPAMSLQEAVRPNANEAFDPIETRLVTSLRWNAESKTWQGSLSAPSVGEKTPFLCQLSWPLFADNPNLLGYGQPFFVELESRPGGIYPTVRGVGEAADAGQPAPAAQAPNVQPNPPANAAIQPLAIGARVRNAFPAAGGREILLELEDAPFWKRFSLEKNSWLPLPPGEASSFAFTANLTSLFVLDRSAGEIRKYRLEDLSPLGSAKLPSGGEYVSILTGPDSDHAPVYVLSTKEALAFTPDSLQRRDVPPSTEPGMAQGDRQFVRNGLFAVTGDGMGVEATVVNGFTQQYYYHSDAQGLRQGYLDLGSIFNSRLEALGVSSAFHAENGVRSLVLSEENPLRRNFAVSPQWKGAGICLVPNSPIAFRLRRPEANTIPPKPPQLACFAYFDTAPFAEFDAPELTDVKEVSAWGERSGVFFDPASRHLATLDAERKNLYLREVPAMENRDQPILLNWPDTAVARGGKFEFKPLLLGGNKFAVEVYGQPGLAKVDEANGTVQVPVGENHFDSFFVLNLKVPGANGSTLAYPIPVTVLGPQFPFVARASTEMKGLSSRGAGIKSLGSSSNEFRVLRSTTQIVPDRIKALLRTVNGCIGIVTDSGRVDFISLTTRAVVGSIPAPPDASYYPAAGALLEFDSGKNTLTRISVPDGKRVAVLTLPGNVKVDALACGIDPASPVTLALSLQTSAAMTRIGDFTITEKTYHRRLLVIDGRTLQTAGWTQPATVAQLLHQPEAQPDAISQVLTSVFPAAGHPLMLPSSRDGHIVNLGRHFVVVTPTYSVIHPYGNTDLTDLLRNWDRVGPTGSLSGLMAVSVQGEVYKFGVKVGAGTFSSASIGTPCGRYRMSFSSSNSGDYGIDFKLTENGQSLMSATRFDFLDSSAASLIRDGGRRVEMLGEEGPLALVSPSGRGLQLVDLNIPAAAKELLPTEFHVVSQPTPCVVEGGSMQYQVRVNNPAAVRAVRLQSPAPQGARISPQGLLIYTAPARTPKTTQTQISIEIVGNDGRVILHEFPVYILPLPRSTVQVRPPTI
jgi:hypothetical protein